MKLSIEEQCPVSGSRPRAKVEPGFLSLALPAFLPSVILFFFFNRKLGGWGGGPKAPPLDPFNGVGLTNKLEWNNMTTIFSVSFTSIADYNLPRLSFEFLLSFRWWGKSLWVDSNEYFEVVRVCLSQWRGKIFSFFPDGKTWTTGARGINQSDSRILDSGPLRCLRKKNTIIFWK